MPYKDSTFEKFKQKCIDNKKMHDHNLYTWNSLIDEQESSFGKLYEPKWSMFGNKCPACNKKLNDVKLNEGRMYMGKMNHKRLYTCSCGYAFAYWG